MSIKIIIFDWKCFKNSSKLSYKIPEKLNNTKLFSKIPDSPPNNLENNNTSQNSVILPTFPITESTDSINFFIQLFRKKKIWCT